MEKHDIHQALGRPGGRRLIGLALYLLTALLVCGCTCQREENEQTPNAPTAPKKPELPENVDKALLEELRSASAGCERSQARQRTTCSGGEKNALVLSFNKGERERLSALPTLVFALDSKDEKLQALAAAVLYASYRTSLGPGAGQEKVDPEMAKSLLERTMSLPEPLAVQVIPAATHVATLAGQTKELATALKEDVSVQLRTMAYRYLMVYGRLEAFQTIRELGANAGTAVVLAAIESPRNMRDWTTAEQESICPWAVQFLEDSRSPVAGNAMAVVSNCTGKELDRLLERIERTLKDKQFSFIHSTALRDVCGPASKRRERAATEAQCSTVRRLQEKAARSSDVKGRVRAMVLSSLASAWPDAKTLALARSLEKESDIDVGRTAGQIVTRLERSAKSSD